MDSGRVHRNMRRERNTNVCAIVGFVLTLLNIAVSIILIVTDHVGVCLIFAAITAFISLIVCSYGKINAKKTEKGKALSVIGIILNILIIIAAVLFSIFLLLFIQACSGIFEGIFQR